MFGDAKTRGLNIEDTRLTCPRKLALLMAIVAIALAWAGRAAADLLGNREPERKSHGHLARSRFRIGLDHIRNLLRSDPGNATDPWRNITPNTQKSRGVGAKRADCSCYDGGGRVGRRSPATSSPR